MLTTAQCEFRKATKTLRVAHSLIGGGFPAEIQVVSVHTGKIMTFKQDIEAGIANEFWDGEMCEYVPAEPLPNVAKLVVYND
jgi:hypothetical protein